jgi:hypothetical protein
MVARGVAATDRHEEELRKADTESVGQEAPIHTDLT